MQGSLHHHHWSMCLQRVLVQGREQPLCLNPCLCKGLSLAVQVTSPGLCWLSDYQLSGEKTTLTTFFQNQTEGAWLVLRPSILRSIHGGATLSSRALSHKGVQISLSIIRGFRVTSVAWLSYHSSVGSDGFAKRGSVKLVCDSSGGQGVLGCSLYVLLTQAVLVLRLDPQWRKCTHRICLWTISFIGD